MASILWLTDRTRYETGETRCARDRFYGFHAGPLGLGIQRKATSLPLVTGSLVHEPLAEILTWAKITEEAGGDPMDLPHTVVRDAITRALNQYAETVTERGFDFFSDEPDAKTVIEEQRALVIGLVWCWVLEIYPWFIGEYRVRHVEDEGVYVVGCTCGLGDGNGGRQDHESRDCAGVGYMVRADVLAEHRQTAELTYHEFKTKGGSAGNTTPAYAEAYETSIQISATPQKVAKDLGKPIDYVYMHVLLKGTREASYNYETGVKDGPRTQQSVLCYGYQRPAMPPTVSEDWQAEYNYTEASGKKRRLTKDYQRSPVWNLPESWWQQEGCEHPSEYWVKAFTPELRRKQLMLVGPLTVQQPVVQGWMAEDLPAVETGWQNTLWYLYDLGQTYGQDSSEYDHGLNRTVPRSWTCRRYGKRYECAFLPLCRGEQTVAAALASGEFVVRTPHHAPEMEQALERGIDLTTLGPGEGREEE